jgi:hypothetical protein
MAVTASSAIRRDQPVAHYLPGDTPPPTPKVARRSLNAAQRKALKEATSQETDGDAVQTPVQAQQTYDTPEPTTDALAEEPRTIRPRRSRSGNTTTMAPYQLPQKTGFPWKALLTGISIPVAIYTVLYLVLTSWILLTNTLTYGPVHTSYAQAAINGEPSVVQVSNINGAIYVTILQAQHDGSIKASTYLGPALNPSAWNGDLRGIVATVEVAKGQHIPTITVHLLGSMSYVHLFFVRPTLTFSLIPDKQASYKVVQS